METKRDKILEKLRKLMNLKESAKALGNEAKHMQQQVSPVC